MRANNLEEWRQRVLARDNHTCQKCGVREGRIVAHHIKDKKVYPSLMVETDNGLALCIRCHKKVPVQLYLLYDYASGRDGYGNRFPPVQGWYYPKRVLSLARTKD